MSKNFNQFLAAKLRHSWLDLTGASFKKKEEIVELGLVLVQRFLIAFEPRV